MSSYVSLRSEKARVVPNSCSNSFHVVDKPSSGNRSSKGTVVVGNVSLHVREPWDLLRGKCVFKQRKLLVNELRVSRLRHFAPNCSTFSRAREIPINYPGKRPQTVC